MKYKIQTREYQVKISDNDNSITSPTIMFDVLKDDFNPVQEELYLLILNTTNNMINKHLIAMGTSNTMMVTPLEIFRKVILTNGNRIMLAHNHPSGNVSPSEEDIVFIRKISKACDILGIQLLDNMIYTDKEYYSFKVNGLL